MSELDQDSVDGAMVELEAAEVEVEDTDDGGAVIRMEQEDESAAATEHFANLVDVVSPAELRAAVSDLMTKIERDKEARSKRDKLYEEGLRRTGLGDDAPGGAQFTGATRVVHPLLVEACVDFSARVMKELFPPAGPVKTKLVGRRDRAQLDKADRKAEFLNWQLTEQMPEFRGELEQLTTQVPLGGAQYLKLCWDRRRERPVAEFVAIDDVLLPFAATNFYTAERKTHVQYLTEAAYKARVAAGMYVDVDLPAPGDPEFSRASVANDKIEGRQSTSYNEDGLRTVYEVACSLVFDDEEPAPYLLTIDKTTERALALYRNWNPDDARREELEWMVEFPFVPWRGAYPIGLTHLIGGLSGAATGALRALLDSAHIQNVPTLLKLKGGPNGQTLNLQPTEVVEMEGGALVDDVRKLAMPVPFNPPSPVLFQLLGFLVDAGRGVVQTSFEKLADQNPAAPVGTTLALIEQGMAVFSSIHSRLHAAMGRVLKILHRLNASYLTEDLIERQIGENIEIEPQDFDGPLDVIPVSDPAIFSETQRFAQVQAIMQRQQLLPDMYDARRVEEMFLRALKVPDDILKPMPGEDDRDPVSENVAAAMGQPIYVLPKQDHMAHLNTHMAFLQSPVFGGNPVIAKTYLPRIVDHLRDHMLNYYMAQAQEGVKLATDQGLIESEADQEAMVVARVQAVLEQQVGQIAAILPQVAAAAQQFAPPNPNAQNPAMAVAQLNAQVQGQALQQRAQADQARLAQQAQLEQMRLQQQAALKQAEMAQRAQAEQARVAAEQMRQQAENARTQAEIAARVGMNDSDNRTAMDLAMLEIQTGEKVAVSTGTGLNPGTR